MSKEHPDTGPGRGPAEHDVRTQIVLAATKHFTQYGYEKTTVAELAQAIGFSKSYIYKFFESKQAVGEVICFNRLQEIRDTVAALLQEASSPSDKLRRLFRGYMEAGSQLFFQERKLYEIAATAAAAPWPSMKAHEQQVRSLVTDILREGRERGEFERKTPLDEAAEAIYLALRPYINPLQLQYNLDNIDQSATLLCGLALRSLAP
ncbi:MAG: TetR/AcrR family transcriptional regulator [Burkholderiales bacterium]|nr:MAG: TetR/AcrR family transcriptional regulator [Burkholderiales bacterium]